MVETLTNIGQSSPLVVSTFIVTDRRDNFFFLFFPPQFQHIRFGETRPFAAARVSLFLFLFPSFLLLVVNALFYRANYRSDGHTEKHRREEHFHGAIPPRVSRNASTKGA